MDPDLTIEECHICGLDLYGLLEEKGCGALICPYPIIPRKEYIDETLPE